MTKLEIFLTQNKIKQATLLYYMKKNGCSTNKADICNIVKGKDNINRKKIDKIISTLSFILNTPIKYEDVFTPLL